MPVHPVDEPRKPRARVTEKPRTALHIGARFLRLESVRIAGPVLVFLEQVPVRLANHAEPEPRADLHRVAAVAQHEFIGKALPAERGESDRRTVKRISAEDIRTAQAGGEVAAAMIENLRVSAAGGAEALFGSSQSKLTRSQMCTAVEALIRSGHVAVFVIEEIHVGAPSQPRIRRVEPRRLIRAALFMGLQEIPCPAAEGKVRAESLTCGNRAGDEEPLRVVLVVEAVEEEPAHRLRKHLRIAEPERRHGSIGGPLFPPVGDAADENVAALGTEQVAAQVQKRCAAKDRLQQGSIPAIGARQRPVSCHLDAIERPCRLREFHHPVAPRLPTREMLPAVDLTRVEIRGIAPDLADHAARRTVAGADREKARRGVDDLLRAVLPESRVVTEGAVERAAGERGSERE